MPEDVATEMRNIVRRAASDVAGLTVAAQVRQAARHLGYPAESWRVREAWYGRAGGWSAAAVDDLRRRFAALREREQATAYPALSDSLPALAQRIGAIRLGLDDIARQVDKLAADVAMMADGI